MSPAGGYRLSLTCCFCGGELFIDEASRTTRCPHCASTLKIARGGRMAKYYIADELTKREIKFFIDRQLKKTKHPLVSRWEVIQQLYLPFWRVTATLLTVEHPPRNIGLAEYEYYQGGKEQATAPEVRLLNKEITVCADEDHHWPITSLGVRAQVVKLHPLTREFGQANHLVFLSYDLGAARERFDRMVTSAARATAGRGADLHVSTVGHQSSVIYFPLWVANFTNSHGRWTATFDPLARRVLSIRAGTTEIPPADTLSPDEKAPVGIIPHRCPNCGTDLPDNQRSVTYYCGNCRRLYVEDKLGYQQLSVHIPQGLSGTHTLFPFWIFDLTNSDWPAKAQLLKALKLIGYNPSGYFVPAFGVANPARLLRLVNHYNRRTDVFQFESNLNYQYSFADVTVSPQAAVELIVPLTVAAKAAKGYRADEAPIEGETKLVEPVLVWLPYTLDHYFWREEITGATIEKAAVRV